MGNYCSIVITCFRRGTRRDIFKKCLNTLFEHTSFPFELILVDNTQNNRGLGKARNEGMAKATGDWLCIADDDILFSSGWLDACAEIVALSPAEYIATPIHVPKERPWFKKHFAGYERGYIWHRRSGSNCMVMAADLAKEIGPFPEIAVAKDGVIYADRIVKMGLKVLLTKEPLAVDMSFNQHSYSDPTAVLPPGPVSLAQRKLPSALLGHRPRCPQCLIPLTPVSDTTLRCGRCGTGYAIA